MMIRPAATPRLGRALLASLALVANFFVTSVPLLHAWSHEAESHHTHAAEGDEADHPHDEVHPIALHDDTQLVHRVTFDLALALPAQSPELVTFVGYAAPSFHPVAPVSSRAPPSPGQARAPPLV